MSGEHPGRVDYELDGDGIAVITINQPARRNAVTYPMMAQLFDHFDTAGRDAACRVIILVGAGDTFCAGTDLHFLDTIAPARRGYPGALHDERGWWNIVACPKPVIAAVDGAAVGMGAEWTSMADVRLATGRARFSWNFAQRGLVPDTGAGTWLLPRQIGLQPALRLLYSGAWLEAREALRLGYVSAVVASGQLMHRARAEARTYLSGASETHARIKKLTYDALTLDVSEHQQLSRVQLLECFRSPEHAEGVRAFLEGRAPRFAARPVGPN
jgi:enoyl-CoA hydratase/carnithine racemase